MKDQVVTYQEQSSVAYRLESSKDGGPWVEQVSFFEGTSLDEAESHMRSLPRSATEQLRIVASVMSTTEYVASVAQPWHQERLFEMRSGGWR